MHPGLLQLIASCPFTHSNLSQPHDRDHHRCYLRTVAWPRSAPRTKRPSFRLLFISCHGHSPIALVWNGDATRRSSSNLLLRCRLIASASGHSVEGVGTTKLTSGASHTFARLISSTHQPSSSRTDSCSALRPLAVSQRPNARKSSCRRRGKHPERCTSDMTHNFDRDGIHYDASKKKANPPDNSTFFSPLGLKMSVFFAAHFIVNVTIPRRK